jgi:hypothetical protein
MQINILIKNTAEIPLPLLPLAQINNHHTIVLTMNPTILASAYTPYMPIILNAIKELRPISGNTNSRWTKFLVHNIPTNASLPVIRGMIESTYPTIKLMQEPYWLVPTECQLNKGASTIVISLQGALNMANICTNTLFICNQKCCISEYFSWTPTSQCHNCQGYSHHTKLCKVEKPTYTICTQQHSTKDHQCLIPSCHTGKSFTYPPLKYATCSAAQQSTNPLCPIHSSHLPANRHKAPNTTQDVTIDHNP